MDERSIGFRVSPSEIYYAIIENSENYKILSISSLAVPASVNEPQKLSFIRNAILTIITQYNINFSGIKLIEGNARAAINNSLIFRFNIEGVLKELLSNSSVQSCLLGLTTNIASIMELKKEKSADMLNSVLDTSNLKTDSNKRIINEHKEAMLVAIAALKSGVEDDK